MYKLTCEIKIKGKTLKAVSSLSFSRSIFELTSICKIELPLSLRVKSDNEDRIKLTTEVFKVGDKVEVFLGYDGNNKLEFTGYIKRFNQKVPLEIEVEDESFKLRNSSISKVYSKAKGDTLKSILSDVGITKTEGEPPSVTIDKLVCEDKSGLWVLNEIKTTYGLGAFFSPKGELFIGLFYGRNSGNNTIVKLSTTKNIVSADELKWQDEKDIKIKIKAISYGKDGEKLKAEVGEDGGEVRTLSFHGIKDKKELKEVAKRESEKCVYTGYQGSVTTFGVPFTDVGFIADFKDEQFPDRGGKYYVEKVEVEFSSSGFRRKVFLGKKM